MSESLLDAVIALEDRMIRVESCFAALDALAGDRPPDWLVMVVDLFEGIQLSVERVSDLARKVQS